jgi:hypothetical protein
VPYFAPLQEEQYSATADTQHVLICIPDGDDYMRLLAGMLSFPGNVESYANPETVQAEGVAAIWNDALDQTDWIPAMTPSQQFNRGVYPWGWFFAAIAGNAISWSDNSVQPFSGYWRQTPAAINNEVQAHFPLPTGVYRIDLYGLKSSICGQQQITWNGNAFPSVIDWYNATTVGNQLVQPGTDITLTDNDGLTINSKMTGKNASATDYQLLLSWLIIRRTGDV